jgi:hypothetical protein
LIEAYVNEQLRSSGKKLFMSAAMSVTYSNADVHGARLHTRFNHGRLYAGNSVVGRSGAARISSLLKVSLLPVVLSLRGWSHMLHAVVPLAWPKVMFWIVMQETAWAIGEAVGYVAGTGNSMEAWS